MSGIGIILDLIRKNPNFYSTHTMHSVGSFSAKVAASGAAASVFAAYPFGFKSFLASNKIAYCDAPATWSDDQLSGNLEDHVSKALELPGYSFEPDTHTQYIGKLYDVELKPLLSAFHPRTFMLTTLRSFLMYYLPLLEPPALEEDDEDFLADNAERRPLDLVTPFHKSVKQIIRESTVVTTRRVLERLAVSYVSQRMAWKLLKDAPKSAMRKAQRGLPTTVYMHAVTRTTLRAHCLGVAASWIVQVGVDIYRTLYRLYNSKDEVEDVNINEELRLLGTRIFGASVRCTASLLFAAIGAGIGAACIRPSIGQWVGCAAGDLAGPIIVGICFDKLIHVEV
ncbi:uncharacterized protein LOC141637929 [Silene latifolia]|uniref:uncharacterized protein LOC141637929 n=1 Tax=Silene latifolia TaxID=37657 RepID=UPI003D784F6B